MNEIQRATQARPAAAESDLIVGGLPYQDLTGHIERDSDLRRRRAAWQLLREKILFFYALVALPALSVWAVWVSAGEQPAKLKIAAGVFLAIAGSGLVHFLTGKTPRLVMLLDALLRAWSSHTRAGPLE